MTAATLEAPQRPNAGDDEPEVAHLVCCDLDTALCGEDVTEQELRDWRDDDHPMCPLCVLVDEACRPCPDSPNCPKRDRDG